MKNLIVIIAILVSYNVQAQQGFKIEAANGISFLSSLDDQKPVFSYRYGIGGGFTEDKISFDYMIEIDSKGSENRKLEDTDFRFKTLGCKISLGHKIGKKLEPYLSNAYRFTYSEKTRVLGTEVNTDRQYIGLAITAGAGLRYSTEHYSVFGEYERSINNLFDELQGKKAYWNSILVGFSVPLRLKE